jgi:hypothetical protein
MATPPDQHDVDDSMWATQYWFDQSLHKLVHGVELGVKRRILAAAQSKPVTENTFFPLAGFSASDYAFMVVIPSAKPPSGKKPATGSAAHPSGQGPACAADTAPPLAPSQPIAGTGDRPRLPKKPKAA